MKPSGESFLEQTQSKRLGVDIKKQTRRPQGSKARPRGVGVPPTLLGASGLLWPISDTPWASSGPKIISVKFQVNWTLFGIPFL